MYSQVSVVVVLPRAFLKSVFGVILFCLTMSALCQPDVLIEGESGAVSCLDLTACYERLDLIVGDPVKLLAVTFESDIPFEQAEFDYLTGLRSGQMVTAKELKSSCFYLEQRRLFSRVVVRLSHRDDGLCVHFCLTGYDRLGKVSLAGVWFGKTFYRQLYGIEQSAHFSQIKHEQALQKILQHLKNIGYFNARIIDKINRVAQSKLVDVTLKVERGKRFVVSAINLDLIGLSESLHEQSKLKYQLTRFLQKKLIGVSYTSHNLGLVLKQFKAYLVHCGFPFADLQFEIFKNMHKGKILLLFKVILKQKQCYEFYGNLTYSSQELLNYLMFSGDPIWHLPLSLVTKDLLEFYRRNGFWQATVDGVERSNCYQLLIYEGVRAKVGRVQIRGLNNFKSKKLVRQFFKKVISAKYYNKALLDRATLAMTDWIRQQGYLDFRVLGVEFTRLSKRGLVYELELVVDEGQLQRTLSSHDSTLGELPSSIMKIGKTVRTGSAQFDFSKMFRLLPYQAGIEWDQEMLEEALFRLKALDAFDTVRLYPGNQLDLDGMRPFFLDLGLEHKFEVRARLGVQKISRNFAFKPGATYKVGISTLYKNLTNQGDQLRFDADLTKFFRTIEGQYRIPLFLRVPLNLTTKFYANKYEQPLFIGSKKRLYDVYQQGGLCELSYNGRRLNAGFNVGLEAIKVSDLSREYAAAIDFSDTLLSKQVPFFFIEPTMLVDGLDDKVDPHHGFVTLLSLKSMIAMDQLTNYFLKALVEQSIFLPLGRTVVFALRFRLGHIFTNEFNVIMPIERFYLGGAYSLRSFDPDFAPPLGIVKEEGGGGITHVPQGGKSMANANFELRFPIYYNLGGVIFHDLGTLLKKGSNLGEGELLQAFGFGLRYQSPVGPLRFDIGWRPRRFKGDANFAWFLTIGQAF